MHPPIASRRALLRRAFELAGLAGTLAGGPLHAARAATAPRFSADPFSLGIASGAPRPDSVVLWTRLAPDPRSPAGGLDPLPITVRWELAEDESFRSIIRSGQLQALPERVHSVHVAVDGLQPARWYHYRFHVGDGADQATSPVGRTRTAPAVEVMPEKLRFAFASCQQYEQGYFSAYRHMLREDVDLVVFLGDYIYERRWGRELVRQHWGPEAKTLDDYRLRHAQYKTDTDLQRMHAAAPWIVTWDDHEVANDYAADFNESLDPAFAERRIAAYRAYFEHMPLRAMAEPGVVRTRLYDHFTFGRLAEFFVLDDRQYRDTQACPRPQRGGSHVVNSADCAPLHDPARSMLGAEQERWLDAALHGSRARWNVLAQQTLFTRLAQRNGPTDWFWTDGWDGYPASRRRVLDSLQRHRVANPLLIGGDVHANCVSDIKADFDHPESAVVATEICGTSISSQGRMQSHYDRARAENPHIRFAESGRRGYAVMELDAARCTTRLRVIDSEKRPQSEVETRMTFVVQAGRAGAVEG